MEHSWKLNKVAHSVLAIILAYIGYTTLVFLILGFAVIALKDEEMCIRDRAYLLARAIQFFAPGIPQVYYVGLLAGANDIALMESSRQGRDINRHYYTMEEIEEAVKRPVVQKLRELMIFRNEFPAFS